MNADPLSETTVSGMLYLRITCLTNFLAAVIAVQSRGLTAIAYLVSSSTHVKMHGYSFVYCFSTITKCLPSKQK
jgi:hypothetical protein